MAGQGKDNALDHVVVVEFENRSLDNVLGRLYGPGGRQDARAVAECAPELLATIFPCGLRPFRTRAPRLTRV
jgi:phospholipase C